MITNGYNSNGSGSVINLSKGSKINLTKEAPGLKKIMVGLGWDVQKYDGADDFDLDASVFLVDKYNRTTADGFVFYNNLHGPNESVIHQGDNRTGADDGKDDDEQIFIDLDKVPSNIEKIAITVTIDQADRRSQNFGMVSNAYLRLLDTETGKEVARFNLDEEFSVETAIVVGEVYKHNGDWKFSAIGNGFSGGLLSLCRNYGLDAEYK